MATDTTSAVQSLLPCPFCGNAKNIAMANEKHDHSGGYFISCPECYASTGLRYAIGEDPRPLLAEQWNRRTQSTPPAVAPTYDQVIAAWNAQADEHNQWGELGEDEKIEWAVACATNAARSQAKEGA